MNEPKALNMPMPRFLPFLLAFCMFSTGASGLVNEYVLATMTTYILGNSIEQFSIIIAAMMLMMGVSGLVQQKMTDDNLIHKFMGLEVAMAIIGGFAPLAIYGAFGYIEDHFTLVHYFFVLSVGFMIGFEIPLVMRIIEQNKINLKANLAIVYAMDYIGAFIGAIIWVKFLLKNYPLTEISFIVAGFNFAVAVITVIYFMHTRVIQNKALPAVAISITACALTIGFTQNQDISNLLEQKFYEDPIAYKETTKYQHLVITENKKTNDVRLYINGNTQFSSLDEARYHELLVHPALNLSERSANILVLGGGDGLAVREILKHKSVKTITLIDLDPAMVELAANNPILKKLNNGAFDDARISIVEAGGVVDENVKGIFIETGKAVDDSPQAEWVASVNVFNIDADMFFNNAPEMKWDTVIIDFPDPSSVELSKLYSKQFYLKLRPHLADNAFIAIQSTSPYHAKEAFLAIGNTMEAAGFKTLPYRQNIPSFGDWGYFLAWSHNESPANVKKRIAEIEHFDNPTEFLTPELLLASFAFGKGELDSRRDCINTIMHPCLLTQYVDYSWQVD